MRFKNLTTGEIFDDIEKARQNHCRGYTVEGCARGQCILRQIAGAPDSACEDFCEGVPEVAAELMGLKVLPDETPEETATNVTLRIFKQLRNADAKADTGKPRPTLVPASLVEAVAAVREYGTAKYGDPENWRRVEPQRYRDALYRHWLAYLKDEAVDAESGLPHLWHIACNVAFLIELEGENT